MSSEEDRDLVRSTVRGALGSGPVEIERLVDLGLLGLLVSEGRGGAGWCPVEASVVGEEIGRAASVGGASDPTESPHGTSWLSITVGAGALDAADDPTGQLAETLDGSTPVGAVAGDPVVADDHMTGSLLGVDLTAATSSIVVIGRAGQMHLVDLASPGVSIRADPTSIDTTLARSRLDLDHAPVRHIGTSVAIRDAAWVLTAAVSVGSLRHAVARLTTYLSDRIAFGAPIASFQVIQHRIVDLTLLEIRAGVAVDAAARALAADPAGASALAASAHALAVERIPPALDECIHLTGGIGFTWEYPLHHEMRRSVADATAFGSARRSREILLEVTGWA